MKKLKLLCSTLAIAVLFLAPLATASFGQAKTLYGTLDAKVRLFRFVVKVDKDGSAKLSSLDEGNREFALDPIQIDNQKFDFELKASLAKYESKYDAESKTYRGTWKQGGGELPLDFQVVDRVPTDPTKEIWEGELSVLGQKMALRFRVYDRDKHSVLMDSPNQRAGGFSGNVERKEGKVVFEIPAVRGKFEGQLSDDKSTLKGTWNQGVELPLELKKISAAAMKKDAAPPKRPQTPKPPFPYESAEVSIENKTDNLTLAATLTLPKQGDKFPCVILISGSGPQDRNESLMDHKPFWVLADHLSRKGIACLRFDDRGTAKSTGDHTTATSEDFATDVSAIVDFLKKHPRINPDQIGLCGHSEGGLIAPMTATQRDDIGFIVMLAGPGVNGEKILRNQMRLILQASGVDEKDIEVAAYLQDQLLNIAKSNDKIDDEKINQVVDQLIEKFPEQEKVKDNIVANTKAGFQRLSTPWMKFFLTYEPAPTLTKVKCPVLVLNGSKDTQVDPNLNLPAIRKAFESAGKKNFQIVRLEGLNHMFQTCQTGAVAEYQTIEETFAPDALEKISSWIREQMGAK